MPNHSIVVTCSKHHILIPGKISEVSAPGWSVVWKCTWFSHSLSTLLTLPLIPLRPFLIGFLSPYLGAVLTLFPIRFLSRVVLRCKLLTWWCLYTWCCIYILWQYVCMHVPGVCMFVIHCWAQCVPLLASPFFCRGLVIHRIGTGETKFWILS